MPARLGLQLKYFVLNPTKEDAYGRASQEALVAYANAIRETNPILASDIMGWVNKLQIIANNSGGAK